MGQRLGCRGVVTAVYLWDEEGLRGAWMADRSQGEVEPPLWRVLILQSLLREEKSVVPRRVTGPTGIVH